VIRRRLPAIVIAKPDADRRRGSVIQEVVAHRDDALGGGRFEEPRRNLVDWIGDDSMMRGSSTDRTDRSDRRDSPKDTHACVGESRHGPAATLHALAAGVALETFRAANQSIGKKLAGGTGLVPRTWARASDA